MHVSMLVRFTVFLIALALAPIAHAQTASGTIAGIVRDSSGGAIPGATVRIVNETTGTVAELISNEEGAYRATALPPGAYRVETSLDGLESPQRLVVLEAGQTLAVDIT